MHLYTIPISRTKSEERRRVVRRMQPKLLKRSMSIPVLELIPPPPFGFAVCSKRGGTKQGYAGVHLGNRNTRYQISRASVAGLLTPTSQFTEVLSSKLGKDTTLFNVFSSSAKKRESARMQKSNKTWHGISVLNPIAMTIKTRTLGNYHRNRP